jgi:hypothetical protein
VGYAVIFIAFMKYLSSYPKSTWFCKFYFLYFSINCLVVKMLSIVELPYLKPFYNMHSNFSATNNSFITVTDICFAPFENSYNC